MYRAVTMGHRNIMRTPDGGGGGGEDATARAQREAAAAKQEARDAKAAQSAAESRVAELEGSQGTELEKAIKRAERAEAQVQSLNGELKQRDTTSYVQNALAKTDANGNNTPQPHDFEAMLKFVDMDKIKTPEDAINAVNAVRESHTFLFKQPEQAPPADPNRPGGVPPQGQSFGVPGGTGAPTAPAVPMTPDGQVDTKAGIGQGLLGALAQFRGNRPAGGGTEQ
jgi:hypothetical protein